MKRLLWILVCAIGLSPTVIAQERSPAIRQAQRSIPLQYVVVLQDEADPDAVGPETAIRFGGRLRHIYRAALRGFAISLPRPAAEALAKDPRVRFVEEDSVVEISQVQANATWGLDRIDQRTLPLDQSYYYGVSSGQSVTVHVIDTGIRATHYEFTGRAFIAGDYVDDDGDGDAGDVANDDGDPTRMDGQDCNGHGTHVAGTIGGLTLGVSRHAVLQAHRVLGCNGSGTMSAVIAAIDAVTADSVRPAVANMSLSADPSDALDEAVRRSVASGVTHVVAAGNQNTASLRSPARVAEAITVGATTSTDARASYSNFGAGLDLFAPGSSIKSAWHTGDTATAKISGTSMAAPHVAGVAALYLDRNPNSTPEQVHAAIVAAATVDRVVNVGAASPNLLLYSGFLHDSAPSVTLSRPNGGEKIFTGTPFTIEWNATDPDGLSSFDVYASSDDGATYAAVPGCTGLPENVRACTWNAPGPTTSKGRIQIIARDAIGNSGGGVSAAPFQIVSGAASIVVTAPNSALNWGRQSTQQIKWTHNLGASSFVRLELSRDGGASFTETIAAAVKNSSTTGIYNWTVTGPNVNNAMIRVTWTSGPASDVSNVSFVIADPFITVAAPKSTATNWGYDTLQRVSWTTNLGPLDRVDVLLAQNGSDFSTSLGTSLAASGRVADLRIPVLAAPTAAARVRVRWSNAPAGMAADGTNPVGFRIEPAFVTVTAPNGGEVWSAGTAVTIRWTSNLGTLELVQIQLSNDEGQSYAFPVLASTKNDGSQAVTVAASWATTSGRIRISWLRNAGITDSSDGNFIVQ
jgi:subtilisin family serine protease